VLAVRELLHVVRGRLAVLLHLQDVQPDDVAEPEPVRGSGGKVAVDSPANLAAFAADLDRLLYRHVAVLMDGDVSPVIEDSLTPAVRCRCGGAAVEEQTRCYQN